MIKPIKFFSLFNLKWKVTRQNCLLMRGFVHLLAVKVRLCLAFVDVT